MFDKYLFRQFWNDHLSTLCLNVLTVDEAKIGWQPWGKSDFWFFMGGLKLGDTQAHLTITPDKDGEFEFFHFTLDQPEVAMVKSAHVRCDHVFFAVTDISGDIELTQALLDGEGKKTTAASKTGLTHNSGFLVNKVKDDIQKIMWCFSATALGPKAGWH